jgi:hypothetical protein
MDRISWSHPRLGRISEAACRQHGGEILAALRTLGIGCRDEPAEVGATCLRCTHAGQRAFVFLPTAVVSSAE